MKKQLLCFDLDQTLVDANKAHTHSFLKAFKKHGIKPVSEKKLKSKFGRVTDQFMPELYPKMSKDLIKKVSEDKRKFFREDSYKYVKPIPGIKLALKRLRKKYEIAVTSNCSHKTILKSLEKTNLRKYVDKIVGSDDVKHPKPCPDEILKAEHLLHLNAEYMIGDTIYDIIAGKKSRTKTIAVLTGNHKMEKLKKHKPDLIIRSVADLPKILLK
ncbi:MAG: HAD family hydrolase [Nanoarchaeota archaeon]|nr:HAD family hydrolase [Nanoarchaeota archaeon]MBU1444855.1 HAD family hydrolase [Nanoarchaeota archaeon]MBU2406738.1 HAD family hydrolase [Nanoarchaeota archaeon]MBU2420914.1 HAD family hydrolase [Nanoarchaeota archaeon]MBU2475133.1 HAD family hydrolase [Nanoarchaeota archaeon]